MRLPAVVRVRQRVIQRNNALRVYFAKKRNATFTPGSLTGLARWYKADGTLWQNSGRTTPVTADADPVGAWDDASGLGNHATQATAGKRPTWRTAVKNGLPTVRFDGVDDSPAIPTLALTGFSIYIVQVSTGDGCFLANSATNIGQVRIGDSGFNRLSLYDGTSQANSSTLSVPRGSWSLVEYHRTGSTASYFENGVAKGTAAIANTITLNCMGLLLGSGNPLNGDLGEIIVCTAENTAPQKTATRGYLNSRFNLY